VRVPPPAPGGGCPLGRWGWASYPLKNEIPSAGSTKTIFWRPWYTCPPASAGRVVRDVCVRWIAVVLMGVGAAIFALALFADALGIGAAGSAFGWKQLIGTMLGAGIFLGGARGWWDHSRTRAGGTERTR
jgi:hypothetical protein